MKNEKCNSTEEPKADPEAVSEFLYISQKWKSRQLSIYQLYTELEII